MTPEEKRDFALSIAHSLRLTAHQTGVCICGGRAYAIYPGVYRLTHEFDCPVVLSGLTKVPLHEGD